MEKIMAVYDVDPAYARRFADVTNQKERVPFDVIPFTSMEALQDQQYRSKGTSGNDRGRICGDAGGRRNRKVGGQLSQCL